MGLKVKDPNGEWKETGGALKVIKVDEGGGSDANIVPLLVGDEGTYDADSPVLMTETFTGEGEPDAVFNDGMAVPMFKAKKLVATNIVGAIQTGQVCYELGGEKATLAINDADIGSNHVALWYSLGVPLCVWVMTPGEWIFTEEEGFEPNSFYIADFWTLLGYEKGTPITVTALGNPDKPIDGYMPVTVDLPIQEELTVTPHNSRQEFKQERSGTYYKNVTVNAIPDRVLTVKPSLEAQTFTFAKDDNGNTLNQADWKWFSRVDVEPFDLTKTKLLCDIELTTLPKTEYKLGEWLDTTGGVLLRKYTDGSEYYITLVNGYVSGFGPIRDEQKTGKFTLVVVYRENGITCRTFYEITVTE